MGKRPICGQVFASVLRVSELHCVPAGTLDRDITSGREWLSVGIGALELGLALLVFRHVGRFGRTYPWLAEIHANSGFGPVDTQRFIVRR